MPKPAFPFFSFSPGQLANSPMVPGGPIARMRVQSSSQIHRHLPPSQDLPWDDPSDVVPHMPKNSPFQCVLLQIPQVLFMKFEISIDPRLPSHRRTRAPTPLPNFSIIGQANHAMATGMHRSSENWVNGMDGSTAKMQHTHATVQQALPNKQICTNSTSM